MSALAYVVIFSIPFAREQFMLDPSNVALTSMALGLGVAAAALIEAIWWVQGRVLGERENACGGHRSVKNYRVADR